MVTPGREKTLAPKPVSSTSSFDTSGSGFVDGNSDAGSQQPMPAPVISAPRSVSAEDFTMSTFEYPAPVPVTTSSKETKKQCLSGSVSLVSRPRQLQISPSTRVVVPSTVPSTNTVPEFLYQLTKMLTDHNRDVIEWSSGKIEVHNPHKLQTHVLNRYFRHSKFASFQRQLNYFGFRKLAGKGKMAPCSYVNDATTNELGSLLLIKRKTGNEPKAKVGKKRERDQDFSERGEAGGQETAVNPVLANILYRSSGDTKGHAGVPPVSMDPLPQSQQAIARVAVGKGIRHGFSRPQISASSVLSAAAPHPAPRSSPVHDSLSALTNNYKNSLQDYGPVSNPLAPDSLVSSNTGYVPGSLSRDDSLVDLAMIPLVEEAAQSGGNSTTGLTFIDFPWQDPAIPQNETSQN